MKRILPITLLAFAVLASSAAAAVVPINSGELKWDNINIYDTTAAAGTKRTFVGFTADPRNNPGAANGTVFADAPALGPIVDSTTAQNAAVTHTFPAKSVGSSYDAATKSGTVEFDGTLHFKSTKFGFDITIDDPQIVLTGTTGKLYATGKNSANGNYDRTTAVFNLDLTNADYTKSVGGTTRITGIVPSVAQGGYVFFANYPTGAGPERDPDTFGAFSLELREAAPVVTVDPKTDIPSTGGTLTVSGTGASKSTPGLYVFLVAASAANTDTNAPGEPPAFKRVGQEAIAANGSFSTTLTVKSPFVRLDKGQTDCTLVPCVVRTVAAEFGNDRSQDTNTAVAFKKVYDLPTATPTATATYTVPTVTPTPEPYTTPKKPKLTKIALSKKKLKFTLSKKAKVTGTIKRKVGKKLKTARKVSKKAKKGRNTVKIRKLKPGGYKVALKPKGGAKKTKTIRIKGKKRKK